jgi:hypothetical protein
MVQYESSGMLPRGDDCANAGLVGDDIWKCLAYSLAGYQMSAIWRVIYCTDFYRCFQSVLAFSCDTSWPGGCCMVSV